MESIILIGFMGSGKSSVGKELSKLLNINLVEMDQLIADVAGKSIPKIFEEEGESGFREREFEVLKESLSSNQIIATGGGVLTYPKSAELINHQSNVFFLKGDINVLIERISRDKTNQRPLANQKKESEIISLYKFREQPYHTAANDVIDVTHKSIAQIAQEIINKVGR